MQSRWTYRGIYHPDGLRSCPGGAFALDASVSTLGGKSIYWTWGSGWEGKHMKDIKSNELWPRKNFSWCIIPKENAEFATCMEDILGIYEISYNPEVSVVCMDEKPCQLLGETRDPLSVHPGDTQKINSEYIRNGTWSIFVFVEPLSGVQHKCTGTPHRSWLGRRDRIPDRC